MVGFLSTLKARLIVAILIPVVACVVAVGFYLQGMFEARNSAQKAKEVSLVLIELTEFMQEFQKERGMSALYLNDKLSIEKLKEQQQKVDLALGKIKSLEINSLDEVLWRERLQGLLKSHSDLRTMVQNKQKFELVLPVFNQILDSNIDWQINLTGVIQYKNLQRNLSSIVILNEGKEAAGKMRAFMTGVLAAKRTLDMREIEKLVSLKEKFFGNFSSVFLDLSADSQGKVDSLSKSEQWKFVAEAFSDVTANSVTGSYKTASQDFFDNITAVINQSFEILMAEMQSINANIDGEVTALNQKIILVVSLVLSALVALISILFVYIIRLSNKMSAVSLSLASISDVVNAEGAELADSSQKLSSSSTQAAASLEETVASVEELSSIVRLNSEQAEMANKLSGQGAQHAKASEESTRQLQMAMGDLSSSSKKISEISEVIEDIAFQTNLLALNAAVEAARAGEHGKGFAVVADAVRTLAQRASVAAKDIGALIQDSQGKTQLGERVSTEVQSVFVDISGVIDKVSTINQEISHSSQQQYQGFSQISQAMNQLDQATQENAASAERLALASQKVAEEMNKMNEVAADLRKIVGG